MCKSSQIGRHSNCWTNLLEAYFVHKKWVCSASTHASNLGLWRVNWSIDQTRATIHRAVIYYFTFLQCTEIKLAGTCWGVVPHNWNSCHGIFFSPSLLVKIFDMVCANKISIFALLSKITSEINQFKERSNNSFKSKDPYLIWEIYELNESIELLCCWHVACTIHIHYPNSHVVKGA